ncbi:impB/mucB/samB family domain-containing protein [Trichoderma breve]|uniref:DNA polymerase kappa n=1 Tax=Trichoderma breve TaxID=2034170 RepID=A0A9W9BFJ6_9HYPO|nr:impB/mucB/samB family domain-containing protein [Trichoderma breve]KAJ4862422.1 impB/mucB/samB family domain-containing protein [Trichoderma breve]
MTSAESTEDSAHPEEKSPEQQPEHQEQHQDDALKTLKYHLLGPSLTKAGQDKVDQSKIQVSEIIYNASKGSKFFTREEERDKILTKKIEQILSRKKKLEQQDLTRDLRNADRLLAELELSRDLTQHIVHLDCDAFFAAVELLERPDLKDVPFAVGGGVLTTCNYVARQFGCRSGMAGFVAKKLCPQLILIKPNFHKYGAKAQEVREVLANYDPRFESASIDEAYLNITEYCDEHNMDPAAVVEQMRKEVQEKTSITVSAGIAANARLAKICSNINKPNGQYVLPSERSAIMAFMRDLPTRKVNGIGRVLERELLEIGVRTCGDLYEQRQYLNRLFGDKYYVFLLRCYLGLGRTKIQPAEEYERKSVGTESTFHDISDPAKLRDKLRSTAEALEKDMKKNECKGRTLCIKIKLHTFEVYTRQVVLPKSIQLADDLYNYSLPMLAKLEQEIPGMKLRLMGLRCTHLVSTKKPDTMAFFGFKPRRQDAGESSDAGMVKRKASEPLEKEEEWERLGTDDDDLLEDLDDSLENVSHEQEGEEDEMLQDRRHGKEIVPNPPPERGAQPEEDWWECPICLRPQAANERQFNEHIDLCLSRQTIRDAVQADDPKETKHVPPDVNKRPKLTEKKLTEKKRGRPPSTDPKQKKLSFF